ncbi:hypothetical protein ACIA5G_30235 [Amycolatopsis sp. NPDC051758]|uniref:hypothetical protein n=1 Tax=Amycolatopsis sp. NPDC051758 TaxID=3363935 RepID=UPI0037A2C17E
MSPKKDERVAPPPVGDEWDVRFGTKEAAASWDELVRAAKTNARRAYDLMRTAPGQDPDTRHHRLKGPLTSGVHRGKELPQWQIEVTGSGRIWYLLDEEHHTVWVQYASLKHPKKTE